MSWLSATLWWPPERPLTFETLGHLFFFLSLYTLGGRIPCSLLTRPIPHHPTTWLPPPFILTANKQVFNFNVCFQITGIALQRVAGWEMEKKREVDCWGEEARVSWNTKEITLTLNYDFLRKTSTGHFSTSSHQRNNGRILTSKFSANASTSLAHVSQMGSEQPEELVLTKAVE